MSSIPLNMNLGKSITTVSPLSTIKSDALLNAGTSGVFAYVTSNAFSPASAANV